MIRTLAAMLLAAATANAATVSGTVRGGEPPATLSGMTVAAYTESGTLVTTAVTGLNGSYQLTLDRGVHRLLAYDTSGIYATSFHRDADSFETSARVEIGTQNVTGIDFTLARAGYVEGRVLSASGAPLGSMTVAAYNDATGTRRGFTRTASGGTFRLVLPPGRYRLAAYDEALQYQTQFHPDRDTFAAASVVTVTSGQTIAQVEFRLRQGARVEGSVSHRTLGTPLASMRATLYDANGLKSSTALTTAAGELRMLVPEGRYRLVVDDPDGVYAAAYHPDAPSFDASPFLDARAGETLAVTATLVEGGRLSGTVRAARSGTALAAITVAAYNADGSTRAFTVTDAAGAYTLVLPPGDYVAGAYDPELLHLAQFHPLQSRFASAAALRVVAKGVTGGIDFLLDRGARVRGRVADAATGRPLAAITVGAFDAAGREVVSASTRADGAYGMVVLPGSYRLVAFDTALDFATAYFENAKTFAVTPPVSATESGEVVADFSMHRGGRINGVVIAESTGDAIGGVQILAFDSSGGESMSTFTRADGSFDIVLLPGTYRLAAADPLRRYATVYYLGRASFAEATPLPVGAGQRIGPIGFRLTVVPSGRRRAAR